ncbi:MAG: hypothetical protein JSV19_02430 [Phycisphaerales bacterium]|nr:MAG: hypothetical protein JSV19_02430 [Phycisphaerales bacterium]
MDSKNLTIGILSTTAVILLVGLIVIHSRPQPVYASGVGVQAGDYVMGVGRFDERTEMLYVIDSTVNGMNVYLYDFKSGVLGISDQVDLGMLRERVRQATPIQRPGRR